MTTIDRIPDLRGTEAPGSGWMELHADGVDVPSLAEARRTAGLDPVDLLEPCTPRVLRFDVADGDVLVRVPAELVVRALVAPRWPDDAGAPRLRVQRAFSEDDRVVVGTFTDAGRTEVVFRAVLSDTSEDGDYELTPVEVPGPTVRIRLARTTPEIVLPHDPSAIVLAREVRTVRGDGAPSASVRPPLLAVDRHGRILPAWSIASDERALVPAGVAAVQLRTRACGVPIATLAPGGTIRDAIFWGDRIALLTASAVHVYDASGCPLASPLVGDIADGLALAADGARLHVAQRGTGAPGGASNLRTLREDGSELAPPGGVPGRSWFASLRTPAITSDDDRCLYAIDPARVAGVCCIDSARPLDDLESSFFRAIADLPSLRRRIGFATSGTAILGASSTEDVLDGGRPGTAWHRVLLFGSIPGGCTVSISTRTADSLDDLARFDPERWSRAVTLGAEQSVPVGAPGDTRRAAADAMILSGPGRFLQIRLELAGDGHSTPRIESIEVERPREGIARFLPRTYRDSTPDDDFLRRWLALFETTAFDGIAARMNAYPELFDPRTAPEAMLPFLMRWLAMPLGDELSGDPDRMRRVLTAAPEIALLRGTAAGLAAIVRAYTDVIVRVREPFAPLFVVGAGVEVGAARGPVLGCTPLPRGCAPTDLGGAPLGATFVLERDERTGGVPHTFELLVPSRALCTTELADRIRMLIDHERPAHTTWCVVPLSPAGWVVGAASAVGQDVSADFDAARDPATYGISLGHGLPRSAPLGLGLVLGRDARLFAAGRGAPLRVDATLGVTTRVSA